MKIEISNGDIIDKLTILEIKLQHITNNQQHANINNEYEYIKDCTDNLMNDSIIYDLYLQLKNINKELWDIEDKIRIKEKNKLFDSEFIELARQVYITNDKRAYIKKQINILSNSLFVEEKSYEAY
jgi:hypothetical protein